MKQYVTSLDNWVTLINYICDRLESIDVCFHGLAREIELLQKRQEILVTEITKLKLSIGEGVKE